MSRRPADRSSSGGREADLRDRVEALDRDDPLAAKRLELALPDDRVYLDGNSLGALPRRVAERLRGTLEEEWGRDLIGSWNRHGWIDLPVTAGEKIAPLIGAAPGQVIVCDSISVNLFKLLAFALALRPGRTNVLSQAGNFPTDLYVAQGLERLLGSGRCQLVTEAREELEDAIDDTVAAVLLTHVDFRSGRVLDMERVTRLAHDRGALVIWDLAHSAGAMPLHLDGHEVDLAVGCGYKYLNGGPGAPAFLYVAKRHQNQAAQPLTGWMGHAEPFAFEGQYRNGRGMLQFLCGTPPILSLSALDAALDLWRDVDLEVVREKSVALGELFLELVAHEPCLGDFELASPADSASRGSHLALRHGHAYEICQALIERGVITDFRAPDLLRIGFTPLYTSYRDVWHAVRTLAEVVTEALYREPRFAVRAKVT